MKVLRLLCLTLVGVALFRPSNAQTADYKPVSIVKVSPFGLFASRLVGGYEKTVNTKFSWYAGVGLLGGNRTIKKDTLSNSCAGFFVVPELRYYFNKRGPSGFYMAGLARLYYIREKQNDLVHLNNSSEDDYSRKRITSSLGLGLVLGYQYIKKRWVIDIAGGVLNNARSISTNYVDAKANDYNFNLNRASASPLDHRGAGFRFTFTLGYILNDS